MVTSGEAISIFTDAYIAQIWEEVQPYLSDEAYAEAMSVFLDQVIAYCQAYQEYLENPEEYVSVYQQEQQQKQPDRHRQKRTNRSMPIQKICQIQLIQTNG